jgi:hypothetical protein
MAQADLHHSVLRSKRPQRGGQESRERTEAPYYETGHYSSRQGAWVGGGGRVAFPPPAHAGDQRWFGAERLHAPRAPQVDYPSPRSAHHRRSEAAPPDYEDRLREMRRREKHEQEGLQRFASSKRSNYTDARGRNVYIRRVK